MKAIVKVVLNTNLQTAWDIITNNEETTWRSDLKSSKILSETDFEEISKEGIKTTFHITKKEPYSCYEFDLENQNIKGHWIGNFSIIDNNQIEIELIEDIVFKNNFIKIVATITSYLKKMQKKYIKDLTKKVENEKVLV